MACRGCVCSLGLGPQLLEDLSSGLQNPTADTDVNKDQDTVLKAPKDNEERKDSDLYDIAHPEPNLPRNYEEDN